MIILRFQILQIIIKYWICINAQLKPFSKLTHVGFRAALLESNLCEFMTQSTAVQVFNPQPTNMHRMLITSKNLSWATIVLDTSTIFDLLQRNESKHALHNVIWPVPQGCCMWKRIIFSSCDLKKIKLHSSTIFIHSFICWMQFSLKFTSQSLSVNKWCFDREELMFNSDSELHWIQVDR